MTLNELIGNKRQRIAEIAAKHGASNVRVFGSFVRGQAGENSDVDLLVDLGPRVSLLDHANLVVELEDLLGRRVDVVPAAALRPRLRRRVLDEAVSI